ncbi:MAG: hypothetical protein BroJett015_46080 [Chloroflexota bacterium]|nr:MAG: hypothetical protein BroJett015_46080 [Chloroflexota bacterium]
MQKPHTGQHLLNPLRVKEANVFPQLCFWDGKNFRNNNHALPGQVGFAGLKQDITRRVCLFQIAGEGADDDGMDAAVVKDVVLNDDVGMGKIARFGLRHIFWPNPKKYHLD